MRRHLYSDFYEGFLHLLILIVPIIVSVLYEVLSDVNESLNVIPMSLLISVIGEIYSARNIYKDRTYFKNKRVKIEIILTLLLLAASLCYILVVFTLRKSIGETNLNEFWGNYTVPVFLYGMSIVPYLIETIIVARNDFVSIDDKNVLKNISDETSKEYFKFNVTEANAN